jgi:hypothetical protein
MPPGLQNRQGGAALRLDGSIPSPLRAGNPCRTGLCLPVVAGRRCPTAEARHPRNGGMQGIRTIARPSRGPPPVHSVESLDGFRRRCGPPSAGWSCRRAILAAHLALPHRDESLPERAAGQGPPPRARWSRSPSRRSPRAAVSRSGWSHTPWTAERVRPGLVAISSVPTAACSAPIYQSNGCARALNPCTGPTTRSSPSTRRATGLRSWPAPRTAGTAGERHR